MSAHVSSLTRRIQAERYGVTFPAARTPLTAATAGPGSLCQASAIALSTQATNCG